MNFAPLLASINSTSIWARVALLGLVLCISSACSDAVCPTGSTEVSGHCQTGSEDDGSSGSAAAGSGTGTREGNTVAEGGSGGSSGNTSGTGAAAAGGSSGDKAAGKGGMGGSDDRSGGSAANGGGGTGAGGEAKGGAGGESAGGNGAAAMSGGASGAAGADSGPKSPCPDGSAPQPETCDNVDNDCDNTIDEKLTEECGSSSMGKCKLGMKTCLAGMWGDCEGAVEPEDEKCDAEEIDENCDGVSNENCPCSAGETKACMKTIGVCKEGKQTCDEKGEWSKECEGAVGPQSPKDICDGRGLDEDCDGKADKADSSDCECAGNETRECTAGKGVCAAGSQACDNGKWGQCTPRNMPSTEVCDGRNQDEDCDGKADKSDSDCECVGSETDDCTAGQGICAAGSKACNNGKWGSCVAKNQKRTEVCDGNNQDEDCDGKADRADTDDCQCVGTGSEPCDAGDGICSAGTRSCSNGKWTTCVSTTQKRDEVCDGRNVDEDCDGKADKADSDCQCLTTDRARACDNLAACKVGTQECVDGKWATCSTQSAPAGSRCSGGGCDGGGTCKPPLTPSGDTETSHDVEVGPGFRVTATVTYSNTDPATISVSRSGSGEVCSTTGMGEGGTNTFCTIPAAALGQTVTVRSSSGMRVCNTRASSNSTTLSLGFEDQNQPGNDTDCNDPTVVLEAVWVGP